MREGLRPGHMLLKTAVSSFLPSQSANRTSWKIKGEWTEESVSRTRPVEQVVSRGAFAFRNSSLEPPSLAWCSTCKWE